MIKVSGVSYAAKFWVMPDKLPSVDWGCNCGVNLGYCCHLWVHEEAHMALVSIHYITMLPMPWLLSSFCIWCSLSCIVYILLALGTSHPETCLVLGLYLLWIIEATYRFITEYLSEIRRAPVIYVKCWVPAKYYLHFEDMGGMRCHQGHTEPYFLGSLVWSPSRIVIRGGILGLQDLFSL